ncbi:MAG: amidohydrolase family protein [Microbacterium sp.]
MIVDVHAHLMDHRDVDEGFLEASGGAKSGGVDLFSRWEAYQEGAPDDTVAIVFGGKAHLSGMWVDDAKIAELARANPDTVVGFLSVDPTQPGWEEQLRFSHQELGLRGIKVMPMYAGFDPSDPAYDGLWAYAQENRLPIVAHTGTTFIPKADLRWARPGLFDVVARRFPELRIVLAHLGHPYEGECLATIRKNPHVYADISALYYRPFQFWHALMLAQDYGVGHKILFGSDFPFTTVNGTVEGLRSLEQVQISGLPGLQPELIEGIIARDSLELLGLR